MLYSLKPSWEVVLGLSPYPKTKKYVGDGCQGNGRLGSEARFETYCNNLSSGARVEGWEERRDGYNEITNIS